MELTGSVFTGWVLPSGSALRNKRYLLFLWFCLLQKREEPGNEVASTGPAAPWESHTLTFPWKKPGKFHKIPFHSGYFLHFNTYFTYIAKNFELNQTCWSDHAIGTYTFD
jgi:hypothetical protein